MKDEGEDDAAADKKKAKVEGVGERKSFNT